MKKLKLFAVIFVIGVFFPLASFGGSKPSSYPPNQEKFRTRPAAAIHPDKNVKPSSLRANHEEFRARWTGLRTKEISRESYSHVNSANSWFGHFLGRIKKSIDSNPILDGNIKKGSTRFKKMTGELR